MRRWAPRKLKLRGGVKGGLNFNSLYIRKMPLLLPLDLIKLLSFISVRVYPNASIAKLEILSSNKEKAIIYLWTHRESGSKYIGSAFDLTKRLNSYYSISGLKQTNSYIYRALLCHTHSAFSLFILEYINVSNLTKKKHEN